MFSFQPAIRVQVWTGVDTPTLMTWTSSDLPFDHLVVVGEGSVGRRLTEAQLRAVAEALATFWRDNVAPAEG